MKWFFPVSKFDSFYLTWLSLIYLPQQRAPENWNMKNSAKLFVRILLPMPFHVRIWGSQKYQSLLCEQKYTVA